MPIDHDRLIVQFQRVFIGIPGYHRCILSGETILPKLMG